MVVLFEKYARGRVMNLPDLQKYLVPSSITGLALFFRIVIFCLKGVTSMMRKLSPIVLDSFETEIID
jgi:hypothetical protein